MWLLKTNTWEKNKTKTDYIPGDGTNLTFNITIQDINLNWTIACWDKDNDQTNSSEYNLIVDVIPAVIGLHSPENETINIDGDVAHIFNVSDNIPIANCSLFTKLSTSDDWDTIEDTDDSITQTINQSINITYTSSKIINWKIGCYNNLNRQGNSTTRQLTIMLPVAAEEEEVVVGGGR